MGAETFQVTVEAKTAAEAFKVAREDALYNNGHGGYTGSIAEKSKFVTISVPDGTDPIAYANGLIDDGDPRIDDKWGPAGCVKVAEGKWHFFGWASSWR